MPATNPEILRWARETAGFTPEEAAKKLSIGPARGKTPVQRLHELEIGENEPSRPMLAKMAQKYRRPLLTFYLPTPPKRGDRGKDFRTLPQGYSEADDALLDALIRNIQARQSMIRAALEDEDEAAPLPFIGSMKVADGMQAVSKAIHGELKIELSELRRQPSASAAFALLRREVEALRVFVLLVGDLGSHHSAIDPQVFRGFALADDVAPFIVINDRDSPSAWAFTLIHELTHLFLGQTGVSSTRGEMQIERFCNDVASEFLLPAEELSSARDEVPTTNEQLSSWVSAFASARNISRSMVAYRLFRMKLIDRTTWKTLSTAFRDQWLAERQSRRVKAQGQKGGPNYYTVRRHRIGQPLIDVVGRMMASGALTTSKAATVLGVKAASLPALVRDELAPGAPRP